MNAVQMWAFLLLLSALSLRGFDGVRLRAGDLSALGITAALAIAQRTFVGQVTLDDPWFAPLLMAAPLVAGLRHGVRRGLVAAVGGWIILALVAGTVPVHIPGELPQEPLVLAAVFSALLAGAAASLPERVRSSGPCFALAWMLFFTMRDESLWLCASAWSIAMLAVGWTYLGMELLPERGGEP